jgi:hypothetical protein
MMARCPNPWCHGGKVQTIAHNPATGRDEPRVVDCPYCGGAYGEVSCCDGPAGYGFEPPADPNATAGGS